MSHSAEDIVIRLPQEAYGDLAAVARHVARLDFVADCVAGCGVTADNPTVIACLVLKGGFSEEEARHLLYGLLNLHHLRRDMQLPTEEFLRVLTRTLRDNAPVEWRNENLNAWNASQQKLAEALCDRNPVALLQKARTLQYAYEHLLRSARILTDVRPVYDDDADEILGGVVTHSLVIEYTEGGRHHHSYFALDTQDVGRLKQQCERAERKAATTEAMLKSIWGRGKQEGVADGR